MLGAARLGPTWRRPGGDARQAGPGTVTIALAVGPERAQLLCRLLDVFVPAHCRAPGLVTGASGGGQWVVWACAWQVGRTTTPTNSRLPGADHLGACTVWAAGPYQAGASIVLDHPADLAQTAIAVRRRSDP